MQDENFNLLKRSIERILGIQCGSYKEEYIKRRVLSRMRIRGKEEYKDYNSLLIQDKDEQEALRNALTINVTTFHRDPDVFNLIGKEIFPSIVHDKKSIKIWRKNSRK